MVGPLAVDVDDDAALRAGQLAEPHRVLGPHPMPEDQAGGWLVRAWHPDAVHVECEVRGRAALPMSRVADGLFAVELPQRRLARYWLRFVFADGKEWRLEDPYRFAPLIRPDDLARFAAGEHSRAYEMLGAVPCTVAGHRGVRFAVWAPHARAVRLVGDFCAWDGRLLPMRAIGHGVFELFVPGVEEGALYKFEIVTPEGLVRLKADPFARALEPPPNLASIVPSARRFAWRDGRWLSARAKREPRAQPVSIYEVHLGSWDRDGDRRLTYGELAPRLIAHAKRFGFTHLELLPISEHSYYPSWGYQVTGYYAPTSRYGAPDDLRALVDACHRAGIGVILDWVPAHFPKDDAALRRFDGPRLFERESEHPTWGTLRFDYARPEVRAFLIANAVYWLREFHFDGLRVDAVSWIVWRDYLEGEPPWTEDPDGEAFLQQLAEVLAQEVPGAVTIAEEATTREGVTDTAAIGGLGFTFKWNMGWMHDTLGYFAMPPADRTSAQDRLTFAMTYERTEAFVNALSHDEVVHLKRSFLGKMPGADTERFANLRLLLCYQFLRPGKKLLFMGTELAPEGEWDHDRALPWHTAADPLRAKFATFLERLGALYRDRAPLWRGDVAADGFAWIDGSDAANSVLSFVRRDGDDHVVAVFNFSDRRHAGYRIGVPGTGRYREVLNTDAVEFGGTGVATRRRPATEPSALLGWRQSVMLDLPPLTGLALVPYPRRLAHVQAPPSGSVPE